ncbi:hypothetical protein ABT346_01490 [Micromonospora peucetia]
MALATLTVDQVPAWRSGRPLPHRLPADGLDAERARVRPYRSGGGDA